MDARLHGYYLHAVATTNLPDYPDYPVVTQPRLVTAAGGNEGSIEWPSWHPGR
jgi:hypothetical protein